MAWAKAEEANYRLTLHLNSGQSVVVYSDATADEEPEDVAKQMVEELNGGRPRWIPVENAAFFSGAVSAIEVEAL